MVKCKVVTEMYKVKVLLGLSAIFSVIIFVFWDALVNIDVDEYQLFSSQYEHLNDVKTSSKKIHSAKHFHIKKIFEERTKRVRKVCNEEKSKIPAKVSINNLIWSIEAKHKLLMCRTAKHGSTTWSNYFVQMYSRG